MSRPKRQTDEDFLRQKIREKLHGWLETFSESDKDKPIIGAAGDDEALTPRMVVRQVDEETEEGRRFVDNWIEKTIAHVMETELQSDSEEELELS